MSQTLEKFTCAGCQKSFTWRPEIAGRRIKCKCGHGMTVPVSVGLPQMRFASPTVRPSIRPLAPPTASRPIAVPTNNATSSKPQLKIPVTIVPKLAKPVIVTLPPKPIVPVHKRRSAHPRRVIASAIPRTAEPKRERPIEDDLFALSELAAQAQTVTLDETPIVVARAPIAPAMAIPRKMSASGIPLAYQRGPTARQRQLASSETFIDKRRDIQIPIALLVVGVLLYLGFYTIHYNLGPSAIAATSLGLAVLSAIEAALLIGFALVVAGPLGVSFGGIGTAILKLAAIAVLTDGIMAWVDGLLAKYVGQMGAGPLGSGLIGLPVAVGIYWSTLTYFFSMDSGDAWMVVAILSFFDRIVRMVLVILLLQTILGLGGITKSAVAIPGMTGSTASSAAIDDVEEAKVQNTLHEAKDFAKTMGRRAEAGYIDDLYNAGATYVWFQSTRDINGHGLPFQIVVELPSDPQLRVKCYNIAKAYYTENKHADPNSLVDTGDPYLIFILP